jgi:RNA polymerase sigma factor (sigma-70 family)
MARKEAGHGGSDAEITFESVYLAERHGLFRFAYLLWGTPSDAEDAVAEAFTKAWPHWRAERIEDPGKYLRRCVANGLRDRHRRPWREVPVSSIRNSDLDRADPPDSAGSRYAVWTTLLRLPPKFRVVLVLRYFEDLSIDDVANLLDEPPGTIKSRCARGLERLREELH